MLIGKIKKELIEQKKSKFKGNIYDYTQVNFSYNSNKIAGSSLYEEVIEEIYITNSFIPKPNIPIKLDDLIKMKNYFQLFDYTLDIIDEPLTKEIIINYYRILKRNTTLNNIKKEIN